MEEVALPSGLQSLTFAEPHLRLRAQTYHWKVVPPSGLQSLTSGYAFDQTMEKVVHGGGPLPSGLQSLTLGYASDQSMERIVLPSCSPATTLLRALRRSPCPLACTV